MKTASPDFKNLSATERSVLKCQTALELRDKGDYDGAHELINSLQKNGEPDTEGLNEGVAAEVLLCIGIITRWLGGRNTVEGYQEKAKNLISRAMAFYESIGDIKKVAEARVELAYCYWRNGELNEARIYLEEALEKLTTQGNTRARALLRLAIVEWSASKHHDSLQILTENTSLFNKITNHAIRGAYHSQLAMVLNLLGTSEKRPDYIERAITEYGEADKHFKQAHNTVYRADVKNNLGFLLAKLERFSEAHQYLDQARRLTVSIKEKVRTAQIDETRAQVFIAEGNFVRAESLARGAVSVLEKSGQQCFLNEALITHGIALSRLGYAEQAQFTLQRAIEAAHHVGAYNQAGLAALTLIEELDATPDTLFAAYDRASHWLSQIQTPDILLRLHKAGQKVISKLRLMTDEEKTDILFNEPRDLQKEVLKYERKLIRQALAKVNGSVTHAAPLLGMTYQGLASAIESRHKDLLKERSPIYRRKG